MSDCRTCIKNGTLPSPPSRTQAPRWNHFPSALLLNTIGLQLISSSMGNSCFCFSPACMLSAWHSLQRHMTNQIVHHRIYQRRSFLFPRTGFVHSLYNHGHTKKKKKKQPMSWVGFFFFWGSRVAWDKRIDTTHSKDRKATDSQKAKGTVLTYDFKIPGAYTLNL